MDRIWKLTDIFWSKCEQASLKFTFLLYSWEEFLFLTRTLSTLPNISN